MAVCVQFFADGVEAPASYVVQAAQRRGRDLEFPPPRAEHALVSPCADNFSDEQVVGVLVLRYGNDLADEPGRTAGDERKIHVSNALQLDPAVLELLGIIETAAMTSLIDQLQLGSSGYLDDEVTAFLGQFARLGLPTQYRRELGRDVSRPQTQLAAMTFVIPS